MCRDEKDILVPVKQLRVADRADRLRDAQRAAGVEQRLLEGPSVVELQFLEERAGTDLCPPRRLSVIMPGVRCDLPRIGQDGRGTKLAAVVAQVSAHKDEGVWLGGSPRQSGQMPD